MRTNSLISLFVLAAVSSCGGCGDRGPLPEKPTALQGHCIYVNGFSKREECREYRGAKWTAEEATNDCKGAGSTLQPGACAYPEILGECVLGEPEKYQWLSFPGNDVSLCGGTKRGCEFFAGGIFGPSSVCGGVDGGDTSLGLPPFEWPTQNCVTPVTGEPAGKGPDGKVCTWSMISAATEEGRHFESYASCDQVRTQRPYYPVPTNDGATVDDPRMADPAYVAELSWLKGQIQSTACVCCHSTMAPKGTSNWYVDQPGNFMNGFFNRGLAMGAGWINTVGFGAYPPEQNNGFVRADVEHPDRPIFVTTDPERVRRFFEAELMHRGKTKADYASMPYGAGPLDDQRFYKPKACEAGEGVGSDGLLRWTQGPARYVYVMSAESPSPGVPPNLDQPAGTVWRIQVPFSGKPVASGAVTYGVVPEGFEQFAPAGTVAPPPLEHGKKYYLYVMADIVIPNARCLFTAP